jgi:hypothetical protein
VSSETSVIFASCEDYKCHEVIRKINIHEMSTFFGRMSEPVSEEVQQEFEDDLEEDIDDEENL